MSFRLERRTAADLKVGQRLVGRDGHRCFISDIVARDNEMIRVTLDNGSMIMYGSPDSPVTVAEWVESTLP